MLFFLRLHDLWVRVEESLRVPDESLVGAFFVHPDRICEATHRRCERP